MPGGSRSNKRKDFPPQSSVEAAAPAKSPKVTGTGRPKRSTQGQGGAAAQLQKVAEKMASAPAKRAPANIPESIGENPMAPQPARPKPRPLAKAPALPNASRSPVPSGLAQTLLPTTGVPADYPRRTDAVAGSIYGFRPAMPLAIPSPNTFSQVRSPIDPALCAPDAQPQGFAAPQDHRYNLPPPYRAGYETTLGSGGAPGNPGAGTAWPSGGSQLPDPDPDAGNEASGEDEASDADGDEGGGDVSDPELGANCDNHAEFQIDEQSPDEDERQALQLLQRPPATVARGPLQLLQQPPATVARSPLHLLQQPPATVARSPLQLLQQPPAAVAQGGTDVLAEFRRRNRAVKPPRQSRLDESRLRAAASAESHEVDPSGDSNDEIDTSLGLQLAGDCAAAGKPHHMRFYHEKPGWLAVLESAKNKFRFHLCTLDPFPTIEHNSAAATACIVEAMADFEKDDLNANVHLDAATYSQHHRQMIKLLFNDASAYRGRLKDKAHTAVDHHYSAYLRPNLGCGYGQAEYQQTISGNVLELIGTRFLLGDPDEQGRATNYGHPSLKSLCQDFYYSRGRDSLARLYPDAFQTVPIPCLILAATAIANALDDYRTGSYIQVHFKGTAYTATYNKIALGTQAVLQDAYHGPKLQRMLQEWANEARLLIGAITAVPSLADYNVVLD